MNSKYNKAIVAIIGGGVVLLDAAFGINLGLDQGTISAIAGVLTPILVYAIGNKSA